MNETHDLTSIGWDNREIEKLWLYNLHYFDDLNAKNAGARIDWQQSLILRWVRDNKPGTGTGWEPYPTSLRTVNWMKWALRGNVLPGESLASLALQIRWLRQRVEFHLMANHLFANAKALVFAGLFFKGSEPTIWLERGMQILQREVREQILDDGGHFERSPMYHSLALEDMLDVLNLLTTFSAAVPDQWVDTIDEWRKVVPKMRAWLRALCHPDGEIAYFNDAATGVAPTPAVIDAYAARLGLPSAAEEKHNFLWFSNSGYIRVDQPKGVALIDVAPLGPDYMPGHGHADTLSFELSLFGQRVLVNSGTSCYGTNAERVRQRGTAAHNTVIINGENSSEVWGGFRVARRAQPIGLEVVNNGVIAITCAHDGYDRLPGSPRHSRQWLFGDSQLRVVDRVSGKFSRAEARFHLHPAVKLDTDPAEFSRTGGGFLRLLDGNKFQFVVEHGRLHCEPTTWHPEFGTSEASVCLVVDLKDSQSSVRIYWGDSP